jgi:DNA-binding transcriptional MerR regulator
MGSFLSINEVSRITGLATHTIRYYEKQFPLLLDVKRSKGGHRQYLPRHLEALQSIIELLKNQKLSIRTARERLGEPDIDESGEELNLAKPAANNEVAELNQALVLVLEKLDRLCTINERRDALLEALVDRASGQESLQLIEQISRCRNETRETMRMYQSLMERWKN